ncbi:MAG: histidinol-phosphate transaminase [Streptosporangiales bacterium]|nr:histidinol-phosphate transaminase [Streptosporangiales bacterium]
MAQRPWQSVGVSASTSASNQGPKFRETLDKLAAYVPGKPAVAPDGKAYKLSSNETPLTPLPSVRDAIAAAAGDGNRYPDNGSVELVGRIAQRFEVPESHVAVGCGSVGVMEQLMLAAAGPGDEVVYAWRSFEAYPILVQLTGATSVQVPLDGETHDLDAMAEAITDRTRLIFVCNPNNPTGTVVRREALVEFLDYVPQDCLVVLDEAYREFVTDDLVPDGLTLYGERPNVAVLRTFSKAYGLAGLRVGFAVAHEPVAEAARKTMLPFTVSSVAQAAAIASLDAEDQLLARVREIVGERQRVRDALLSYGYQVVESQANFVWLRLGTRTPEFAEACAAQGVAVRPFGTEGVRVSVAERAAGDRFLGVARAFKAN